MGRHNDDLKALFARIKPETFDLLEKISDAEQKSKAMCVEDLIESKRKKYCK